MPKIVRSGDEEWIQTFTVGSASASLHSASPSDEQRKEWSREDELRDRRRRLPLGFRAPSRKEPT